MLHKIFRPFGGRGVTCYTPTLSKLVVILGVLLISLQAVVANAQAGEQDAIAIAAQHSAFADLTARESWSAAAYDTHNSYGIWRVQFWNEAGEDAGWADVNIERGRVYSWDSYFDSTPEQDNNAQDVIENFIRSNADIIELMPDIVDAEKRYIYIDYDGWSNYWGIWVDAGEDSLWLTVTFDGGQPDSLENPTLSGVYFPNVVSYSEWVDASKAEAVSIAFQQPEIAAAVRDHEGWESAAEAIDADTWTVNFTSGDQTLAQATVNILAQSVIEFNVS